MGYQELGPAEEDVARLVAAIQETWRNVDFRSPRDAAELAARVALLEWRQAEQITQFDGLPEEWRQRLGADQIFMRRYHHDPVVHALVHLVIQLGVEIERLDPRRRGRQATTRSLVAAWERDQSIEDRRSELEQKLRAGWVESVHPEEG